MSTENKSVKERKRFTNGHKVHLIDENEFLKETMNNMAR